jgi:hypothetical protein
MAQGTYLTNQTRSPFHTPSGVTHYIEQVSSFQPLQSLPGAAKPQPSVTHLTVDRVHLAHRQKSIDSKGAILELHLNVNFVNHYYDVALSNH